MAWPRDRAEARRPGRGRAGYKGTDRPVVVLHPGTHARRRADTRLPPSLAKARVTWRGQRTRRRAAVGVASFVWPPSAAPREGPRFAVPPKSGGQHETVPPVPRLLHAPARAECSPACEQHQCYDEPHRASSRLEAAAATRHSSRAPFRRLRSTRATRRGIADT